MTTKHTLTEKTVLTALVAETDAVWSASRDVGFPHAVNLWEIQQEYRQSGLHWSSSAATAGGRKRSHQALAELIQTGAVTSAKSESGHRVAFVRLSDAAYDLARRLAGLPGFAAARVVLDRIAAASRRPAIHLTDAWISETGFDEQSVLPALTADWLVSRADSRGRVYYAVTPAGWRVIDSGEPPTAPAQPIEPDPRLREFYVTRLEAAVAKRATREPVAPGEVGLIPLPVSQIGVPVSCWSPDNAI